MMLHLACKCVGIRLTSSKTFLGHQRTKFRTTCFGFRQIQFDFTNPASTSSSTHFNFAKSTSTSPSPLQPRQFHFNLANSTSTPPSPLRFRQIHFNFANMVSTWPHSSQLRYTTALALGTIKACEVNLHHRQVTHCSISSPKLYYLYY
jgi:hypothetical protein